jgi:hypothetical protein
MQYPTLARMARDYLAVPASSTDSERSFSHAHLIGTDHHNRLVSDNFEALQILRSVFTKGIVSSVEIQRLRAEADLKVKYKC